MSVTTHEGQLYKALCNIFPTEQIHKNVKNDVSLKYLITGGYMELDLWIPQYQLCFEFQDNYHYTTTWYFHKSKESIFQKDYIKQETARRQGRSLIQVPCWWNGSTEELIQEIIFHRPDIQLLGSSDSLLTLNPPREFFPRAPEGVDLMLVSLPSYNFDTNTDIWWMGEKYDGIRCLWQANENICFTRYGKEIPLLEEIVSLLPQHSTDSELWFGRGQFYLACVAIKADHHSLWPMLRLMTFDIPKENEPKIYEERYQELYDSIPAAHPFNLLVPRMLMMNDEFAQSSFLKNVIQNGGEGIILQKHGSTYELGRSPSLVKLKNSQGDQEAIVVAISPDNTVTLKLPNDQTFEVSPHNILLPSSSSSTSPSLFLPPSPSSSLSPSPSLSLGDIVSFSYDANSRRDIFVNAKILRIRSDITWQNVIEDFVLAPQNQQGYSSKPIGYWSVENIRKHLVSFADGFNLDPLLPETWVKVGKALCKSKSGKTILAKFNNSYYNTLQSVFPNVDFSVKLFQRFIWGKVANRRKFFDDFARSRKFDPLKPENWYPYAKKSKIKLKGLPGVLSYHGKSVAKALVDLYPDIGLDPAKFVIIKLHKRENRRKYFENFAKEKGFDPLIPHNWYQPHNISYLSKVAKKVLLYHGNSVAKALCDLFPNIGLQESKFKKQGVRGPNVAKAVTAKEERKAKLLLEHKQFFLDYAESHRFNPQRAQSWYLQSPYRIMRDRRAQTVMSFYGHSVPQALVQLFPDIGLDISKML